MAAMFDPRTGEAYRNVPDAEVGRMQTDFGLLTDEQWQLQQKYGGAAEQAAAAGKLAANVATFGAAGFDSPEDKQSIEVFRQKSPTLSALTEMAGAVAPGVAGGALGGAVMSGLGLAGRAAEIGSVVAEDVAGSTAVEKEHALEEGRDIDPTNIIQSLPLALGVSAAARAGRTMRSLDPYSVGQSIGQRLRGAVTTDIGDQAAAEGNVLARARATSEARRSVGAAGAGPDTRSPLSEKEVFDRAMSQPEIHAQINRLGGEALEDAVGGPAPAFDEVHNIGLKKEDVAGRMQDANPEELAAFNSKYRDEIEALADNLQGQGHKQAADQLRQHVIEFENGYEATHTGPKGEDRFAPEEIAIPGDRAKRTLDKLRSKYGAVAKNDVRAESIVSDIDGVLEPLREDLKQKSIFGDVWTEKQVGENERWTRLIRSGAQWQSEFLERAPGAAGRARRGLQEVPVFQPRGDMVEHALGMNDIRYERNMNAARSWIEDVQGMSQLKTDLGVASIEKTPVMRLNQALEDFKQSLNEIDKAREVQKRGGSVEARRAAKAAAQSAVQEAFEAVKHVPGIGHALRAADYGGHLSDRLFAPKIEPRIEQLTREQARAALKARETPVRGAPGRPPRPPAPPQGTPPVAPSTPPVGGAPAGGVGAVVTHQSEPPAPHPVTDSLAEISANAAAVRERAALGLVAPASRPPKLDPLTARFKGNAPDLLTAFENKIQDVQAATENPQAFIEGATKAFGQIAEGGHEELFTNIVARTQIAAQYVAANAPPSVAISMTQPDGHPPDSIAIMQWAALYEGAFNPGDVVHDVNTGDATPDQIRALREVHPDVYGALRADVLKQIGQGTGKMPFETLRMLDNLFAVDGAAGPAFAPGMTATLAAAYASKGPKASVGGKLAPSNIAPDPNAQFRTGPSILAEGQAV